MGSKFWAGLISLTRFPLRCPLAPESQFFSQEIRQRRFGKRGRRYRILFNIENGTVNILFVRHYAQDWLRPEDADEK